MKVGYDFRRPNADIPVTIVRDVGGGKVQVRLSDGNIALAEWRGIEKQGVAKDGLTSTEQNAARHLQDAEVSTQHLESFGRKLVNTNSKANLRETLRQQGFTRAQEAFIVGGWVQARKEAGLSENV